MKKFKFYTNTLKTIKEADGTRYIIGVASSTGLDRDEDRMSEAALHTMKSTAEANLTLFTNHEYKVPDDLFGSCVEATIKARKDEEPIVLKQEKDGKDVLVTTFMPQDLEVKVKVVSDAVNPKAGQIYRAIEEGVNLGFSIGGAVKKFLQVKDAATDTLHTLIDAIDLYEISLVGIPANADAMNVAISKSISGEEVKEATEEDVDTIIAKSTALEGPSYDLEGVRDYMLKQLEKELEEFNTKKLSGDADMSPWEFQELHYAKAQAENVLMTANMSVSVDENDLHEIHLQSHAWDMEWKLQMGQDTAKESKHIKKHLKMLQAQIDELSE